MPKEKICLIASDEEDEDGNLKKIKVEKGEILPGEVVYLPDCSDDFKSEEEELSCNYVKVNIQNVDKKKLNGNYNQKFNTNKKIPIVNSAKRTHEAVGSTSSCTLSNKKAKYERQATPICDAIMREYSKRQKNVKLQQPLSNLNDIQIKNILDKAKKGNLNSVKSKAVIDSNVDIVQTKIGTKYIVQKNPDNNIANLSTRCNAQNDPLTTDKPEIEVDTKSQIDRHLVRPVKEGANLKPVKSIINVSLLKSNTAIKSNPVQSLLKEKTDYLSNIKIVNTISSKHESSKITCRRSTRKKSKPPGFGNTLVDEDNSDEDPTYSPTAEEDVSLSSKINKILHVALENKVDKKQLEENPHVSSFNITNLKLHPPNKNEQNKKEPNVPKPEAVSLGMRLKILVDKIADALTSETSPKIENEAHKLLQTTHELLKHLGHEPKQSLITDVTVEESIENIPLLTDESLFNNINFNPDRPISCRMTIQEKYAFILDYFTSYKQVFTDHVIKNVIPILSEFMKVCMDESLQSLKRKEDAEIKGTSDDIQREVVFNSRLFASCSEKFFPWFNLILDKIINNAAYKANIITLIVFITGTLFLKSSKYKCKIQEVRKILINMAKSQNISNNLLCQVLQTPEDLYLKEIKFVIHILKYFKERKFVLFPTDDFILNFEQALSNNISKTSDKNYSPSSLSEVNLCESGINKNMSNPLNKLSKNAVQFVEALQSEQQYDSNRIENKLDNILSVLCSKDCVQDKLVNDIIKQSSIVKKTAMINKRSSRKSEGNLSDQNEDRSSMLAELLDSDHSGLNSLFNSYLTATSSDVVNVKIEPLDITEESDIEKNDNNLGSEIHFINIKEEPEDRELYSFPTVWSDTQDSSGFNNSDSCMAVQDICEVESSSIKEETFNF